MSRSPRWPACCRRWQRAARATQALPRSPKGPRRPGRREWLLAGGRYMAAIGLVGLALVIALLVQEWGVRVFLFSFYAAVVGAAWIGTGPGVVAVMLSVVAVQYFFTPPEWSFDIAPEDVPFTGAFILCAVMILAWSWQRKRSEQQRHRPRDHLADTGAQRP